MKFVDRVAPILRLGLFLTVAALFAFALLLRSVRADRAEVLWGLGAQTMEYPGVAPESPRELQLNGARVSFRTQTIDAPLEEVLAHYESLCAGEGAGLAQQLSVQAARDHDAGYVACVDLGEGPRDLRSLADRLLRFSESGDLAEIGALRYARARRVSGASGDETFLFTLWADAAFNLFELLPDADLDGGGSDLAGVPRPPDSQRVLSAWESGQPSGVIVYRVLDRTAAEIDSFYRSQLANKGWTIIERHPSESISIDGVRMISAERGNRMVTVLSHLGEASETLVSVLSSEPS